MSNAPAPTLTIEQRVEQYVTLRDMIKEKNDAHKAAMEPFNTALAGLNNLLMQHLQTLGVESAKTGAGTVYQKTRNTASIEDGDVFMKFVISSEAFELLDRKANTTAVQDYVATHGTLPPGVKFSSMVDVGVRRK